MTVSTDATPDTCGPEKRRQWYRRVVWVSGWLSPALVLVVIEILRTRGYVTIGNLDFFGMVERAKLLPANLSAWVQGFYPVGIPLLLRIGLALGLDVVRTGQIVSILGGIACLYGGGLLAWSLARSRAIAAFAMAYLLTSRAVLAYAGYEGTDMLAAGLQVLALGILARDPSGRRVVLTAGIVNGLAYLARYTALILLAVCLAYLLTMALFRRERRAWWAVLLYGAGFLLGALPQLLPSLLVTGNPFYQTQAYHIWIKLYANNDFVRVNMQPAPVEISLWEVFWLDPYRFVVNWCQEFMRFWVRSDIPLEEHLLAQLAKAGFLFAVLDVRRLSLEYRVLLSFAVVGTVSAASVFTVKTRFLIHLVPVLVVCVLYFLWRIVPAHLKLGKIRLPVNWLALGLLWVASLPVPWEFAHQGGVDPRVDVIEVSNMLRAAGARMAEEVVSTNLGHQDVSVLTRDRFTMLYRVEAPPTVAELRQMMSESGYRFLLYDSSAGLRYHPQYEELLYPENRHRGYTPVWVSPVWAKEDERFAVYRIEPDNPAPQVSTRVDWAGGISLLGYDLIVSADQPTGAGSRVGLYLYWLTAKPVTTPLKVFVHLLNPNGVLVAQHDSVPAMWTYPTLVWQPGEMIIDFHWISGVTPGVHTVVVGLYREDTGERWPVLGDSTQPDRVVLTEIDQK